MDTHFEEQPRRTFQFSKYVLAADSILPSFRSQKLPGKWCTIDELVERFPDRVVRQDVGPAKQLPKYVYAYTGTDPTYMAGVMPETTLPADFLLRIKQGRSFGRHCVIYGPDSTGLAEFDCAKSTLSILRNVLPGSRLNPRYWKHVIQSMVHEKRLPAVRYWRGRVAALNAPSSHNYFHWIAEILPRLITLQKSGITPRLVPS